MKLSKRLKTIKDCVTSEYSHIWDCCCDHGLLGASLLSEQHQQTIHFVDVVPNLMDELESKLQCFYSHYNWQVHCIDVALLPLDKYSGNHLIIIAGIGGDLMIHLINEIHNKYKHLNISFLLCPVHHQYVLRQQLIRLDYKLLNEVLVEENKRFYEIIHVNTNTKKGESINPVGENIWEYGSEKQKKIIQRYLHKTLKHYKKIQQGSTYEVQHIINAYNKKLEFLDLHSK